MHGCLLFLHLTCRSNLVWDIIDKVEFGEKLAVKMSRDEKRKFSF